MQRLTKIFYFLIALHLTGCSWILYKPDIQQGNIISQDNIAQLKIGMTVDQVRYIMGTPLLDNTFEPNRWDYVYTLQPGKGRQPIEKKHVTLFFTNGILQTIQPN